MRVRDAYVRMENRAKVKQRRTVSKYDARMQDRGLR
jgi:hypothetical protein